MNIIEARITSVALTDGSDYSDNWKDPMVKIITDHGVFIDAGDHYDGWLEVKSHSDHFGSFSIHIEPCKRTWKHTWAKLVKLNENDEFVFIDY